MNEMFGISMNLIMFVLLGLLLVSLRDHGLSSSATGSSS